MPELPDVAVYLEALERRIVGAELQSLQIHTPFLLRSVDPAPAVFEGRRVTGLRRLGKRLVFGYDGALFSVIHLMIAGRLHWADGDRKPPGRKPLLEFQFSTGKLTLTEAGSKRRASLHLVRGEDALAAHNPGGIEPLEIDAAGVVRRERVGAAPQVQRRAPLRAGLGERELAGRELELEQGLAARRLAAGLGPVQPAGDHQVDDAPEIAVVTEDQALAEATQSGDAPGLEQRGRRIDRAQQERRVDLQRLELRAEDPALERLQVDRHVRKLGHDGKVARSAPLLQPPRCGVRRGLQPRRCVPRPRGARRGTTLAFRGWLRRNQT